jgi:hypothetical protein
MIGSLFHFGRIGFALLSVTHAIGGSVVARVDDFKYLGSWLMNSMKDFEVRKALAWKAATRLVKIWKRKHMSRSLKLKLFLACVESVLLYNAVTWTMNNTLTKRLDGCYTRLFRYALGYTWTDKISLSVLHCLRLLYILHTNKLSMYDSFL